MLVKASATEPSILLLGSDGQLGHELRRTLAIVGTVTALNRRGLDLGSPESVRTVVRRHRPNIIVNAAAYTAVDRAESEAEMAHLVNGEAPRVLAEEAQAIGACLVHYSTDYVFDGRNTAPYSELDVPNPLSQYGRSKLAGEIAVRNSCQRHIIFRVSWLVGIHGSNFLKTILRLATEQETLRVVFDQCGAPTSAALVADVTAAVLTQTKTKHEVDSAWGLFHLAAAGETNWHAYAQHVVAFATHLGLSLRAKPETVIAIPTEEYRTAAARPRNSRLNTDKLRGLYRVQLPAWQTGVDLVLKQLIRSKTK